MSKKEQTEPDSFERVTLPVVLGIQPDTYMPGFLAILVSALLLAGLIVPGFLSYGSEVSISSSPHGAAVYIDGSYAAETPAKLFIPAGEVEIRVEAPFHADVVFNPVIEGRRFASVLFPVRTVLHAELTLQAPMKYSRSAVKEFADWSLAGPEQERYRIPAVLSPAVHHLILAGENAAAEAALQNSSAQIQNSVQARDFLNALLLAEGPLVSASSLLGGMRRIGAVVESSATALLWLDMVVPSAVQNELRQRGYFIDQNEAAATSLITGTAPHGFGPEGLEFEPHTEPQQLSFVIDSVPFVFRAVPETSFLYGAGTGQEQSGRFPFQVDVDQFYLLETPVNREQYAAVTGNTNDSLDGSGLVPQTGVNYKDIVEYVELLNEMLVSRGYERLSVRLMTSAEWEAAARWNGDPLDDAVFWTQGRGGPEVSGKSIGNIGLSDMVGNVWEWTSSWYYSAEGYQIDFGYRTDYEPGYFEQSEKIVRGASWTNRRSGVSIEQIGIQPPEWRTDYLGFRIVLEMR